MYMYVGEDMYIVCIFNVLACSLKFDKQTVISALQNLKFFNGCYTDILVDIKVDTI